jgi:hypothetical protein
LNLQEKDQAIDELRVQNTALNRDLERMTKDANITA